MRFHQIGNKRDTVVNTVYNADTLTILQGAPLFLQANGTKDGLAVVSGNNLAAALQGMFFGLATQNISPSTLGEAVSFGFFDTARIRVTTRAASTDVWASFAAGGVGDCLLPVTGTGVVAASVSADMALSNAGSAAFSLNIPIRLGATYASATTQASSLTAISGATAYGGATATAAFTTAKVFVRQL
jgi:hypothetical protein